MRKKIFNFTTEKDEIKKEIDWIKEIKRFELVNNEDSVSMIFTNGCFDLIHSGHVYVINESKKLGNILIVGMNSDASVKLLKGNERPIVSENDRAYILSSLSSVDILIMFDEYSVANLIEFIKPDIITKGSEYSVDDLDNVGGKFMKENGKEIRLIPYKAGMSTTALIKKFLELQNK
jgi:rfaE bifunctional protein nucleotidyltransferase chain/domain